MYKILYRTARCESIGIICPVILTTQMFVTCVDLRGVLVDIKLADSSSSRLHLPR
jgi:hypothetical protein